MLSLSKFSIIAVVCVIVLIGVLETKKVSSSYINESSDLLGDIIKDTNYVYPALVPRTYDPDQSGWECMVYTNDGRLIESVNPEEILLAEQISSDKSLILPAGHWVEVLFRTPIVDGPGADLFITGYGAANVPEVSLVGPNDELVELEVLDKKAAPSGFTIVGYDLAKVNIQIESSQVRVINTTQETQARIFRFQTIRARLPEGQ